MTEPAPEQDSDKVIVNPKSAYEISMDATACAVLSVLDGILC